MFCVKQTVPDLTDPSCYKLCYFIEVLTEIKAKNKIKMSVGIKLCWFICQVFCKSIAILS